MKESTARGVYFAFFFICAWCLLLGTLGAANDLGFIDLEWVADHTDEPIITIFVLSWMVWPVIAAYFLTEFKLKKLKKVE